MSDASAPPPDPAREAAAKEYESIHNRLFVVRIVLTVALLAFYFFSGLSAELAEGLRGRFGDAWWLVNALYILITLFAFSALLFPLSMYADHYLEHRYGLSNQTANSWFTDWLKGLGLEVSLLTLFLGLVYALLRWTPDAWWIWATALYVLFAVVLSTIAPVLIMPLFHKFEPLDDPDLCDAVKRFVEQSGLKVLGVFTWGLEEKTRTANAALTGLGRTRRIILGDTMLRNYSQDEIIAVLAHEVGHYKHRDMARLLISGTLLAAIGFYIVHVAMISLIGVFGFASMDDIGAFPLLVFCLFLFSLITMPLGNLYSRRREFAADEYAVRATGAGAPMISALEKLADQNLADKEPAPWIEFLLHSHPSIVRRIERIRRVERQIS